MTDRKREVGINSKKVELVSDDSCPECGSAHLYRDDHRAELVCNDCGLVVNESEIDTGPEWRAYTAEDNKRMARTGAPLSQRSHDLGLSTVISYASRDFHGNPIPAKQRDRYNRMRMLHRQSNLLRPGQRSLVQALTVLDRMASVLGIPPRIRDEAALITRKALKKGMVRGRSIEGVVAASLYAACRMNNVPRTLEEMSDVSGVDRKKLRKAYSAISRQIKLKVPLVKPEDYVSRFCSKLDLGPDVEAETHRILNELDDSMGTSSFAPSGTVAAAIYVASVRCGEKKPQRLIAEVAGVSEVTIRNRFQFLNEKLKLKFPNKRRASAS
ncbi:MAG: transcription initiation factor IIB [Thermoplasmata archaeon]|nr:transcription initiation factor IIB [Thermoplasmata archaeon]